MKKNMFKRDSVKKNYIFNMIYQIFSIIAPLIATPYVSRVLLADGIGKYSYTFSLANYFVLLAALGINMYAQREIANHQGNVKKQSILFWENIIVKFCSSLISILIFVVMIKLGVFNVYTGLMWCWIISIIAQAFDITFLFQGIEKFDNVVIKNIIIKLISIVLMFVCIKDSNDIWVYIVLTSGATLVGNLSLWIDAIHMLDNIKFKDLHPTKHIKPALKLFIPTIAVSLYTVLDKTLIGLLIEGTVTTTTTEIVDGVEKVITVTKKYAELENGYYEQSEKIVKMAMTVVTALATVMISRNANELAKGNREKVRNNLYISGRFVMFLGIPIMFGLIAIAPNLIPWFLGEDFEKAIVLMQLFAPLVLLIGMSNVFGLQYLIPKKKDTQYTLGITCGAITNIILNLVLIPKYWAIGAVAASLIAEAVVTFTMYMFTKEEMSIFKVCMDSIKNIIAGISMLVLVLITQNYLIPSFLNTAILIFEGCLVYFGTLLILKDSFLLNLIKSVLHR